MRLFRRRDDSESQDESRLLGEMWSPERVARLMEPRPTRPRLLPLRRDHVRRQEND